ncbi:YraN family protein [Janibacter sp. DB-40]|uniref:YraN family protein n=1 Tax=Janibacter sp. DB-40 TaxID=3028808 RepID=UPI0024051836|nr:YraN family protein [Janibacter sp. DB-40]
MTEQASARAALGVAGEDMAQQYLTDRGMVLLDRNWRCREGEIDLVLRDGGTVVVCEVKTRRTTTFGEPIQAITRAKLARLRRLAGCWLADHPVPAHGLRLDVVALLQHPDGSFSVDHRPGVGQ